MEFDEEFLSTEDPFEAYVIKNLEEEYFQFWDFENKAWRPYTMFNQSCFAPKWEAEEALKNDIKRDAKILKAKINVTLEELK